MLGIVKKKPSDQLDYDVNYSKWLSDGDALMDATAVADAPGLTIATVEVFDDVVKVWLSGGVVGESYQVIVTATTIVGRVKEVTFIIRIVEC